MRFGFLFASRSCLPCSDFWTSMVLTLWFADCVWGFETLTHVRSVLDVSSLTFSSNSNSKQKWDCAGIFTMLFRYGKTHYLQFQNSDLYFDTSTHFGSSRCIPHDIFWVRIQCQKMRIHRLILHPQPADEPEPPALSPLESESAPAEPLRTPLEVVIPLIRDLEKSQIEMKKWFLRQFTQMLRDHNQMIQQQMSFQQQITEISRGCHIFARLDDVTSSDCPVTSSPKIIPWILINCMNSFQNVRVTMIPGEFNYTWTNWP